VEDGGDEIVHGPSEAMPRHLERGGAAPGIGIG